MSDVAQSTDANASGRFALPRITNAWYIVCRSDELRNQPLARQIWGRPLVVFRGEGGSAAALLDRCAHRNVPLSVGRCARGLIECAYHGWRFDAEGVCRSVPALIGPQEGKGRRVPAFRVREQQGYVWVYANAESEPTTSPYVVPHLDDPHYVAIRYEAEFTSTLYNALENALDVPHTAFLHRGLFRGGKQNRITARVQRFDTYVEAEFIGEPVPAGVLARLLAPGGGTLQHFDRFLLPSIAQVEYRLGKSHLVLTDFLTPIDDFRTKMHAVGTLRLPFGGNVAGRLLTPLARRVLAQDQRILGLQVERTQRFAGESFVSTDVDVLGPHILRLMRQAERGEVGTGGAIKVSEVELLV